MKKIIIAVVSILSITCVTNIFSSDERVTLLDKKTLVKKGVFELISHDPSYLYYMTLRNNNRELLSHRSLSGRNKIQAPIDINSNTELTITSYFEDPFDPSGLGYAPAIITKIATYTFTPGKNIKVIWEDNEIKPQKSLIFKSNNVTQNDINKIFYKSRDEYEKEMKEYPKKFVTDNKGRTKR